MKLNSAGLQQEQIYQIAEKLIRLLLLLGGYKSTLNNLKFFKVINFKREFIYETTSISCHGTTLKNAKGEASTYTERLEFYAGNHDDIFEIVERLKSRFLMMKLQNLLVLA